MSGITLDRVERKFGSTTALSDISIHVPDGEFLVLLGPSGCGKSTLLRIIAGLLAPTGGRVIIDERDVTKLPPGDRDIAMVFQSYALYPHLTVERNLGFGLKVRHRSKEEISAKVRTVADQLKLSPLLARRPKELSGGQRQRVAPPPAPPQPPATTEGKEHDVQASSPCERRNARHGRARSVRRRRNRRRQAAKVEKASSTAYPTVPSSKQVSITLASYMPLFGPAGVTELNDLVTGFEALHPNIHVTTESEDNSGAIAGQIQQDEVAGHTPDVVQETFDDLKFATSTLGALDLDEVVGTTGVAAEFSGQYKYAPAAAKLATVNGQVYGIPWTLSTPILFYNASLFTQAGLNPKQPPTNWTEVQSDAAKIKSATGATGFVNGCIGAAAEGTDWCLQAIIDSAGGSVLNSSQSSLSLTAPKTVFALKEMQALGNSGAMANLSETQTVQAFAAGKLGMFLETSALQSTLASAAGGRFEIVGSRMPGFGTKAATPTNSGSALFMFSKAKLKQEADWELIQYLTSPASMTSITEHIGYPPLRPSIVDAPRYLTTWASSNPDLAANLSQLEHLTPWLAYPGPNYAAITTIVTNAASNIAFEGQNPASTLASAQSQGEALIK